MLRFNLTANPLNPSELLASLDDPESGGWVTFEGRVRRLNQGKTVKLLEYEAFPELAEKEGMRILEEASRKWEIRHALALHRTGVLRIGEPAVWVGVAAPHRDAAFAACRYIIDELKRRVPIWKKETYENSTTDWIEGAG